MKLISCLFVLVVLFAYIQAQDDSVKDGSDNGDSSTVDSVVDSTVGSEHDSSQDGFTLGATVDEDSAVNDSIHIAPSTDDSAKNFSTLDGYIKGQAYFTRCVTCDGFGYCFEQFEDYQATTACWNCKGNRLCYKHTERLNPVCVICGGHRRCYPAYYNHYTDCFKCNSKTICYKSEYIIPQPNTGMLLDAPTKSNRAPYPYQMN